MRSDFSIKAWKSSRVTGRSLQFYSLAAYMACDMNTIFSLSIEMNEQADAGRDCRTRLARPNSQARAGTGKYSFSLFS